VTRGPRSRRWSTRLVGTVGRAAPTLAVWGGLACIIPESHIVLQDEFQNMGAVRIVEPTPITPRADQDCDDRTDLPGCPQLADTLGTGLVRPQTPLCECPSGKDFGLQSFDIYVEDPDADGDGNPTDDIYGVLILDMPADATDPRPYLAYRAQLPSDEPARRYRAADVRTIERPDPNLKIWTIGQPNLDLCNDNGGMTAGIGVHTLRLVVTDRPWYRPVMLDADGKVVTDDEGEAVYLDPVVGMPDLAGGATYDTAAYVFQCFDANDPPEGIECSCEVL